ncbi:MAG: ABC transporter permease, partial [Rhodobacteraceae bacterium]|nr:ABC transporter permease [Paracoccaceae bacterium]
MAGGAPMGAGSSSNIYRGNGFRLMLPAWATIGFFLLLPVILMGIYSFLTKEFRG